MRVFFCKANHGNIRVDTSRTPYTQVIFVNCDGDGSGSRRLSLDRCRYGLEEQQGGQFLVGQPKALWHFFFFFLHKSSSRCPTPTVTLFDRQDGTTQHYSHIQQYQVTEKQINSLYIPGARCHTATDSSSHHLTLTRVHSVCRPPIANSHSQRYPEKARVSLSQRLSPLPPPHMSP